MGKIAGRYRKPDSNDVFEYIATYSISAIGVTYKAEAGFGGLTTPFVQGVIAWGSGAFPPKRRVREAVEETLSFTDAGKLRAMIAVQFACNSTASGRIANSQLGCLSMAASAPVWQLDHASAAVRLTRPAHRSLPGTFMLGYTGLNCQQPIMQTEVEVMQSSSICAGFQAKAAQPNLPAFTSLTGRSTGTSMLRIAAR